MSGILQKLAERIDEIESRPRRGRGAIALGIPDLEKQLDQPAAGGSLIELVGSFEPAGVWTLGLIMAGAASADSKSLVIVDTAGTFYPLGARSLGVDLRRLLLLRPRSRRDADLATAQSLRCPGVGAVLARCETLRGLDFRRFQLAAEAGGGVGFLLRPPEAVRQPSFAALRLLVQAVPSRKAVRRWQVEVLRCQGSRAGQVVLLEMIHEADHVRVSAPLADPAASARTARATG